MASTEEVFAESDVDEGGRSLATTYKSSKGIYENVTSIYLQCPHAQPFFCWWNGCGLIGSQVDKYKIHTTQKECTTFLQDCVLEYVRAVHCVFAR